MTVRLHGHVQAGLYGTGTRRPAARCSVAGPSGHRIVAEPVSGTVTVTTGGRRWYLLAALHPPVTGDYTVTCGAGADRYGISHPPAVGTLVAGFAGGLGLIAAAGMVAFAVRDRRAGPYERERPARPAPSWETEPRPQRVR